MRVFSRGGPRCAGRACPHGEVQPRAGVASKDDRLSAGLQRDGSFGVRVAGHLIGSRLGQLCAHGCGTSIVTSFKEEVDGNKHFQLFKR
eukprot:4505649-Heterocapsa_arctica.AAC.1